MAKNDYPVIVYQILSYLYKCLKSGDDVQGILLNYDSPMFDKLERPAENGASFNDAHNIANDKYNYGKALDMWKKNNYAKIQTHRIK